MVGHAAGAAGGREREVRTVSPRVSGVGLWFW